MASGCVGCGEKLPKEGRFCPTCGQPRESASYDGKDRPIAASPPSVMKKGLEAELSGERRTVTALFADVVGSTALMETIDPEDWTAIVTVAFDLMSKAVHRYEGTIAQLQGDALVAFFGAPVAHEDDPERAVRAALDMISGIQDYRVQLKEDHGVDFQIRAGINTGMVLAGNVGTDLRNEYTALGDAMNVAARMEGAARPGTVLMTDATYRLVSGTFDVEDLGPIPVKGKAEPIHAFEAIGVRAKPAPRRGMVGLRSPMVGRDHDLDTLKGLIEILQAGRGRAVCLIGEPGIGKTRLLSEFKEWAVSSTDGVRWVEGRTLSYGRSFAYHLVLDLVRSSIGTSASASQDEAGEALRGVLAPLPEDDRSNAYAYLGHLLGLPIPEADATRLESMDPETLQMRYLGGLKLLANALTAEGPLVMVLEDLHWSDAASATLLGRLLALAAPLPILTCVATRPDPGTAGWQLVTMARETFGDALTELHLSPLAEVDSRRLMASLLEIESLPERVRQKLLTTADGNPFFLEELIKVLIDRGAIVREGEGWVATMGAETVQIPDSLRGLLLARIDQLSQEAQRSLKVASVIGRQFPARVLEKVLEASP